LPAPATSRSGRWAGPRCRPHSASTRPIPRDGRRHCGQLERILVRQWADGKPAPSPSLVQAIDRLADLPAHIADRLADQLNGIWVGPGPVTALDEFGYLRGLPLRPDRPHATWDLVAGAFAEGRLVVGSIKSASYDVMLHEVGHALDHIDGMSPSSEFTALHSLCKPVLANPFYHDHPEELFAEGFALVITNYPAALVTLMGGNEARAGALWAYFRRHYQIGKPI
jgi:Anthrax toxin lethal factor, N- and C-terminal domain